MTGTPDDLRDPDCLPFAYDHVITAGDLHRVLNETLRPILDAVSPQTATVTSTTPLAVTLDDGTTQPAKATPGFKPAVGTQVLVLSVPAGSHFAVVAVT